MAMGKQVGRLSIRILPDATKFREDLKLMIKRVEASYAVNLEVLADTRKAEIELLKFRNRESLKKIDMSATVKTLVAEAKLAAIARDRFVELKVRVDQGALKQAGTMLGQLTGARLVGNILGDINKALQNLDLNIPKITRVALGIATIGSAAIVASAGLVTLGSDLTSILNTGYLLPAIIGSLATGVTVLALALKDSSQYLGSLGPAMGRLQDSISANFWNQAQAPILDFVNSILPQLSDGVARTADALGRQAGAMADALKSQLGGGVMTAMFDQLVLAMDNITKHMSSITGIFVTLGTVGSTYMPRLTEWIGQMADKFDKFLKAAEADGSLKGFIEEGITNLKLLGSSLQGIAGIFGAIDSAARAAGGGGLATFSAAVNGAATIMNGGAFQGALTSIISGATVAMAAIGTSLKDFGDALVFLAPTIESVLGTAGQAIGLLVSAISEAIATPEFAGGLKDMFDGIKAGIEGVLPAIPAIVGVFAQLGSIIGVAAAAFLPLITNIKDGLAPVIDPILEAIQGMIPVIGEGLAGAIGVVAPAFAELGSFMSENVPLIQGLIGAFIGVAAAVKLIQFGAMVAQLATGAAAWAANTAAVIANKAQTVAIMALYAKDFVVQMAKSAAALATQAAAWVANTAAQIAAKVAIIAGAVAQGIATAAQWALNAAMTANPIGLIIAAIVAVIAALVFFFTQTELGKEIWANFTKFLGEAWNNIVSFVTDAVQVVSDVINNVVGFIVTAWQTYWDMVFLVIGVVWGAIVAAVQGAIQLVSDVISNVVGFIVAAWTAYWDLIFSVIGTVWAAIVGAIQAAIQFVSDVINNVVGFIVAAWTNYWNVITTVIRTVWNAILSFVSAAIANVRGVIQTVMSVVVGIWNGIWDTIRATVQNVVSGVKGFVQGLVDNVKNTIEKVVTTVTGIKDKIVGFFMGAGKWLLDAGKSIVQGLIDGITGMIQGAKDAIGGVMDAVSNFLPHSPAKEGAFSGRGWTLFSGQAIGEGLSEGMESSVEKVRRSALSMMNAARVDVAGGFSVDDASTTIAARQAAAGVDPTAAAGDRITVEGNVGYDPDEIADAIAYKKRQAAMLNGLRTVMVA